MLELLPKENRKRVAIEYTFRISNIALIFLFSALILLTLLFIPSYYWSTYRNENLIHQLDLVSFKADDHDNPTNLIRTVNNLTKALTYGKALPVIPTEEIQRITSLKGKGIKISTINLVQNDTYSESFSLSGIAETRNDLINFQKRLKDEKGFGNVVLPINSIIKNTNADFTITFVVTK